MSSRMSIMLLVRQSVTLSNTLLALFFLSSHHHPIRDGDGGWFQPRSFGYSDSITAVAQVLVQLVYFLHMNTSSEQRWNMIAFIYTILCIAVLLIGSVWIMNYLHYNMMI